MFIFGGDRHHMPFNDLFFLDIDIWFKSIDSEANAISDMWCYNLSLKIIEKFIDLALIL